jgi:hypothetical protein
MIENWDAVMAAPGAFIFFFFLSSVATFAINYWGFHGQFKGVKEQIQAKEERIKLKTEQLEDVKTKLKALEDEQRERYEAMIKRRPI